GRLLRGRARGLLPRAGARPPEIDEQQQGQYRKRSNCQRVGHGHPAAVRVTRGRSRKTGIPRVRGPSVLTLGNIPFFVGCRAVYSSAGSKGSSPSSSGVGPWAASKLSKPPAAIIRPLISSVISGLS